MRSLSVTRCLIPAVLALVACGDDSTGTHTTIPGDTSNDVQVGDWSVAIVKPILNGTYAVAAPIEVEATINTTATSALTSFTVEARVDGTSVGQGSCDSAGQCRLSIAPAYGEHTLEIEATAPDGSARSAQRDFLVNDPPPAPAFTLTPAAPGDDDDVDLTFDPAPANTDTSVKGGGEATKTIQWREVDGNTPLSGIGTKLPATQTTRGKTYEVRVWFSDGWGDGPATTKQVTIGNGAPSCGAVLVSPAAAHTTEPVTCRCTDFDDPDGDADQSTCEFFDVVTDTPIAGDGSCTLPASALEVGMEVGCRLTPNDGTTPGSAIETSDEAAVPVLNSPPSAPVAGLAPATADATTELTCTLVTAGADPDGDSVTHTIAWTVNGQAKTPITSTALPSSLEAGRDDAVCCIISADDGKAETASPPACVTLGNAPPDEVNVFVSLDGGTPPASRRSTLACMPQEPSDPDGDALTYTYVWTIDGEVVAGATGSTFSAADADIGDVIGCTLTICDASGACTDPIDSKIDATIQNALPQIGDVDIVDDDAEATPTETISCTYDGWDDPDGDPAEVTFSWILVDGETETELAGEDEADLVVDAGLPVGAYLVCRVTPWNGDDAGAAVESDPIVVGAPVPVAPTVALDAPEGADGTLTCRVATAGEFIPVNATWTWRWSVNGTTLESASGTTLAASAVSHCDLVRCWVDITSPAGLALSSNRASASLPLGNDCDDGNPCTAALCLAAGGCNSVPQDGSECDDGDPCSSDEICNNGECVGTVDICVEDRLSIQPATSRPYLAANDAGGYVAQWYNSDARSGILRATDADESRTGDEERTYPTNVTSNNGIGQQAVSPSGVIGLVRSAQLQSVFCNCPGDYTSGIFLRKVLTDGTVEEVSVGNIGVGVTCTGACLGRIHENRSEVVAFADESMGVLWAYQHPFTKSGIRLRGVGPALELADQLTLVPSSSMYVMNRWDAELVPDGSASFVLAWVGAGGKTVQAQRFAHDGTAIDVTPLDVVTLANEVSAVAVTAFQNGRFVVVWEGVGADAGGVGIAGQRFDEAGQKLGGTFIVPAVETGEQLLGGIAPLPAYKFVVTYRDASTPTVKLTGRIFSSAGVGGPAIAMNEASTPGASAPSVVGLSTGEWLAAWVDGAGTLWTRRYNDTGALAPRAAEVRANRGTSRAQETPSAAGTTSGHVLVAYASEVFPASNMATEIVTRVFDPDGVEVRAEAMANEDLADPDTYLNAQTTPAVAGGADRFVVVWNDEEGDGSADSIFARLYDDMGDPLGTPFQVNVTTDDYQRQPAVAMAQSGAWLAVWNGASSTANSISDVYVRGFAADGTATPEKVVNAATDGPQERPAIAAIPFSTQAVVVWQQRPQAGGNYDIWVRKVGFDGVPVGTALQVNTTVAGDQKNPTVTVSQTGATMVCWESAAQGPSGKIAIVCQRLQTSTLIPQGTELLPLARAFDQSSPVARYQANGRLAIAFTAPSVDSTLLGIQLVRVNDLGTEVSPHLVANRTWGDDQTRPWIVPQDDRVFVGWQSNLQDGSEGGVYFRVLPLVSP